MNLNEIIEKAKPELQQAIIKEFKEKIIEQLKWSMSDEIQKAAKEFLATEVLPLVKLQLAERKIDLVSQLMEVIPLCVEQAKKALTDQATKNLSQSWNIKKIMEGFFN